MEDYFYDSNFYENDFNRIFKIITFFFFYFSDR